MAKQGLLIFNGCSFSVFKYILVSVERAWQSLITVCFGLKLLIVKYLKGQLGPVCFRGSSENRRTPSPGAVLLPPKPWGASPAPRDVSSQLCLVLVRNLWQQMCSCFVAGTPAHGGWVATRAQSTAWGRGLQPVPKPCLWGQLVARQLLFQPTEGNLLREVKAFCASTILSVLWLV